MLCGVLQDFIILFTIQFQDICPNLGEQRRGSTECQAYCNEEISNRRNSGSKIRQKADGEVYTFFGSVFLSGIRGLGSNNSGTLFGAYSFHDSRSDNFSKYGGRQRGDSQHHSHEFDECSAARSLLRSMLIREEDCGYLEATNKISGTSNQQCDLNNVVLRETCVFVCDSICHRG